MSSLMRVILAGACIGSPPMLPGTGPQAEKGTSAPVNPNPAAMRRLIEEAQPVGSPGFLERNPSPIGTGSGAELVRQLDDLARDIQVAWLMRGLD